MSNSSQGPKSLSEAIERLEKAGAAKVKDFKEILERDYNELRENIEVLKPHLDQIKNQVENEVSKTKNQVEENVKQNPWLALGTVGLLAFTAGLFFGQNNVKNRDK